MPKIMSPSHKVLRYTEEIPQFIELCGRTAYQSQDRIAEDSAGRFCEMLKRRRHESVFEHASISVAIVTDRGVSHELVRHRMASYTQESTRYCRYGSGIAVIDLASGFKYDFNNPADGLKYRIWLDAMEHAERSYLNMLAAGATPEEARSVLPNSTKTQIVMTANVREWLHVFELRTDRAAHPQMREVMSAIQADFKNRWPEVFA